MPVWHTLNIDFHRLAVPLQYEFPYALLSKRDSMLRSVVPFAHLLRQLMHHWQSEMMRKGISDNLKNIAVVSFNGMIQDLIVAC